MRASARIDLAVFQLTPTRTRCDLVILANGRTEKIASGLLNPFLLHLKGARDQMAVGGYSIELKPDPGSDSTWFTKGTLERFVRSVSTPEILKRVDTLESEILQLREGIGMQTNKKGGIPSPVEEYLGKSVENAEAAKPLLNTDDDKAIVLYKPNSQSVEANGSTEQEGNSKVDLLKVLETRRNILQKEQGMAFACALAAGFEIDSMDTLISFAQCFAAARLMDACKRFLDLWKKRHESSQWLEIESVEATSAQSDFMAMNASCIALMDASNWHMSTPESKGLDIKAVLSRSACKSPSAPAIVEGNAIKEPEQIGNHKVKTYYLLASPSSVKTNSTEKQYQAPYAQISSQEDPCSAYSEYCRAPPACLDIRTEGPETVKVHVSDSHEVQIQKLPETVEKQSKESSAKGFKMLLKFGRKSSNSTSSERIGELDNVFVGESEVDGHVSHTDISNEAYTLKNLISQDETPAAAIQLFVGLRSLLCQQKS